MFLVRGDEILFDPGDVTVEVFREAGSSLKVEKILLETIIARRETITTAVKGYVFPFISVPSNAYNWVSMEL